MIGYSPLAISSFSKFFDTLLLASFCVRGLPPSRVLLSNLYKYCSLFNLGERWWSSGLVLQGSNLIVHFMVKTWHFAQ